MVKTVVVAPEPTTTRLAAGVVVFKPILELDSERMELAVVELPVYLTMLPLLPAPESLLLKFKKSEPCNWPVLVMEAKGRLMTRELELVEMLKMLPAVPVETLETTPEAREMVEVPERLMPVPAVKSVLMSEKEGAPEPLLLRTWKVVPPRVERKVEPS